MKSSRWRDAITSTRGARAPQTLMRLWSGLRRVCLFAVFASAWLILSRPLYAHDLPLSYVDLRVSENGIDATLESSAKNFARELSGVEEETLLADAPAQKERLLAAVEANLLITADGQALTPDLREVEPLAARRDLRLRLQFSWKQVPEKLAVRCALFSADPRHKTFLNIYQEDALRRQEVFDKDSTQIEYALSSRQSIGDVITQFVREGVHHIFIGPDHILFIVGLLLLGGTLGRLLRIVTAFTIAHSVTLVLATLNILSPPARVIEPAIALSIIFVGAHALLQQKEKHDWRLLFAFCFGFIHGFGFANVLREMRLPPAALGWSLFSFNVGVEIGQACIVLAVAPLLALLYRRSETVAARVITASSFGVVFAGSFWFVQRLFA